MGLPNCHCFSQLFVPQEDRLAHVSFPLYLLIQNIHAACTRFQDGVAYQEAVQYAMNNTDPSETLIISTADHGHAVAYNGYCGRGSPVTGLCMEIDPSATMHTGVPNFASDGSTFTVLSVGNGPGSILYEGNEEVG